MRRDGGLPLDGVRVLEFGNYIAAPTAGRLLADFGAEVIKVERPATGDELRKWRLFAGETSMLYRTINRNKKSITVDLKSDSGREVALDLVSRSDVLIENFRPKTLDRWGLGPEVLHAANPNLVVARISAFGQTGPLSSRPGFAAVAEAFGGLRELVGEPDRPPSRVGVSIGDSVAGLYAAFGIVMALFERESYPGDLTPNSLYSHRHIDVALYEAVFSMMESLVPDFSAYGVRRRRTGGRIEGIAPSNAYSCKDGENIVIAGNGDSVFRRLMAAIGRQDMADDPGLQTNDGRWSRRDELDRAIGAWTLLRTRDEVLAVMDRAGVPAGPIYSAEDILQDQHFIARGMIQHLSVDVLGDGEERTVAFPGVVPILGERSVPIKHVGPDLGAHNHEVIGELLGRHCGCEACDHKGRKFERRL